METPRTIKATLVSKLPGTYTYYVFENLSEPYNSEEHFLTMIKCPNWLCQQEPKLGETGYVSYMKVNAGEPYVTKDGEEKYYRQSAYYFKTYLKDTVNQSLTKEYQF